MSAPSNIPDDFARFAPRCCRGWQRESGPAEVWPCRAYARPRGHGWHHCCEDAVDLPDECAVSTEINAAPDKVWALLTRADDMVRWNSTLTNVEGNIEPGGTVKMQVPEAPGRTFKVKVTRFVPNQEMVWRDGNPVMFLGVRTYSLTPRPDETATRFELTEVFSGLMLPMIAARLPDFGPIFERYAADLKAEAEK
jgi:uncharacterized protein YndB with AHSA1/START domain